MGERMLSNGVNGRESAFESRQWARECFRVAIDVQGECFFGLKSAVREDSRARTKRNNGRINRLYSYRLSRKSVF